MEQNPSFKLPLIEEEVINQDYLKQFESFCICQICEGVIYDGLSCSECDNTWCRACIEPWLKKSNECPYRDKNPTLKKDRKGRAILEKLKFKCRNNCGIQINYSDLENHYKNSCPMIGKNIKNNPNSENQKKLLEEIEILKRKLSEKDALIEKYKTDLENERNKKSPNEEKLNQSQRLMDRLNFTIKKLNSQREKIQTENTKNEKQIISLRTEIEKMKENQKQCNAKVNIENDSLRMENDRLKADKRNLTDQVKKLNEELTKLKGDISKIFPNPTMSLSSKPDSGVYKSKKHQCPLILMYNKDFKCKNCQVQFGQNASYSCTKCPYDLCINCKIEENEPKIIKSKYHEHELKWVWREEDRYTYRPNSGWDCDNCKCNHPYFNGSYHCKKCSYDLCMTCRKNEK
ncbi:MAG: hypothetical protein MJ252_11715 [archaeon]|nr:hypothetical protein [archaeon]